MFLGAGDAAQMLPWSRALCSTLPPCPGAGWQQRGCAAKPAASVGITGRLEVEQPRTP